MRTYADACGDVCRSLVDILVDTAKLVRHIRSVSQGGKRKGGTRGSGGDGGGGGGGEEESTEGGEKLESFNAFQREVVSAYTH
jgi:hypothetical protein